MNDKEHWEKVYSNRPLEDLGWYELHLQTSLSWLKDLNLPASAPLIDIGGGASTLVDDLLQAGYRNITILDISDNALSLIKQRLGEKSDKVTWVVGDIVAVDLPRHYYRLWHDRAVFHFLTTAAQQLKYRDNLLNALQVDGDLIIGTFAHEAPATCSGLAVQRYTPAELEAVLGNHFQLLRHQKEKHLTPGGTEQMYLYCHFQRKPH